ncbi:transcriptional regulator [Caulobacter henricii]|uniref:Transcriptional regulator n=2 Tax=Caulobacter henricii TaxID=69395 RepID=A0A0P0NYI3_9CAUL|nr:transcriptional regulator [Caulobacter henricii]ALL12929.1 transcriptional regulator [Caulobacter henricii]
MAPEADGRRRRGQNNRARIVTAMLEIIRTGDMSPSAEQVAARADVGLRTVFRHFKDMDSLYSEMSVAIADELRAVVGTPFQSVDWKDRVLELVDRRAFAFEKIAPFKHASEAYRHRSRFLSEDSSNLVLALRQILVRELRPPLTDDPLKVEALDLLLSFEAWSRLRREQGLSIEAAAGVLRAAVRRILDEA